MRLKITERCQGHAMCVMAYDRIEIDDIEGQAFLADPNIPAEDEVAARLAADACPERAIEIEE